MSTVKAYQIGLGSYGWHGFEKLIDLHLHGVKAELELMGVVDPDHERLEKAENYARAAGLEIKTYSTVDEMYRDAGASDSEVMVYDASPSTEHAEHLQRSVANGFYHLAEKPPSMTRDQHLEERKLEDAMWKVDFIERESPVVQKTEEVVAEEDIDSLKVYRQSSIGVSKLLNPIRRSGILGGDVLDKMTHEIYVLDLLEAAGQKTDLELETAVSHELMPYRPVSDSLMGIDGSKLNHLSDKVANGMTSAKFRAGDADIQLKSSWLGVNKDAREEAERLDSKIVESSPTTEQDQHFIGEECRFFVLEGTVNLLGDMLHGRLYDLDNGEELETSELPHDQLYRVIRKAARRASGRDQPSGNELTEQFMGSIFDVREETVKQSSSFHEELESAKGRVRSMLVRYENDGDKVEA